MERRTNSRTAARAPSDHTAEHVFDLILLRHVGFVRISLGTRSTDRVDDRLGAILAGHVIESRHRQGLESNRAAERSGSVKTAWTIRSARRNVLFAMNTAKLLQSPSTDPAVES
jgi:hypothetical protein